MYHSEHEPPHFHAAYAEYEALVSIATLEILRGELPRRALALVLEWASMHRAELLADWRMAAAGLMPLPIAPLE